MARIKELHEQSQFTVALFGMAVCGVSTVTNLPVHNSLTVCMFRVSKLVAREFATAEVICLHKPRSLIPSEV